MSRRAGFVLGLVLVFVSPASHGEAQGDARTRLRALQARVGKDLTRLSIDLALFDQMNRVAVLRGEMGAADADAALRKQAAGSELGTDQANRHRQVVAAWVAEIGRCTGTAHWPAGGDRVWLPIFTKQLEVAGHIYQQVMEAGVDPVVALQTYARATALCRGEVTLNAVSDPFVGQRERLAAAMPSARSREYLAAALGLTTPRGWRPPTRAGESETIPRPGRPAQPPAPPTLEPPVARGILEELALQPPPQRPLPPPPQPPPVEPRITQPDLPWIGAVFSGMDADLVGRWGNGNPDGAPDGHFRVTLKLVHPQEVTSIAIKSADARGVPVPPHHWSSRDPRLFVLAVWGNTVRVNPSHLPSLGMFPVTTYIDLYASDADGFLAASGRQVVIEVLLASGQVIPAFVTLR